MEEVISYLLMSAAMVVKPSPTYIIHNTQYSRMHYNTVGKKCGFPLPHVFRDAPFQTSLKNHNNSNTKQKKRQNMSYHSHNTPYKQQFHLVS